MFTYDLIVKYRAEQEQKGASVLYFFGIAIGINPRIKDIGQKKCVTFCEMFENVRNLRIRIQGLQVLI
jgi:hypothetical protein